VFPSLIIFTDGAGYSTHEMISIITSKHRWQSTVILALHAPVRFFSKRVGRHYRRHDCWIPTFWPYVIAAVLPWFYIKQFLQVLQDVNMHTRIYLWLMHDSTWPYFLLAFHVYSIFDGSRWTKSMNLLVSLILIP
jgi:hypothetical protein